MALEDDDASEELASREPSLEDLIDLCRELNTRGAKYVVVGGFAIRASGYLRLTHDIDLVVESGRDNERLVFKALESLPDQCVKELEPGDISKYIVVRVADEILIDLMASASGVDYEEASRHVREQTINGVPIPFASPELLWKMKRRSHREKDAADLIFLRKWFESNGQRPPD